MDKEKIDKLKYYLGEYTKHFDAEEIAIFVNSHFEKSDIDSALKRSMRKYGVNLEEVYALLRGFYSETKNIDKRDITIEDVELFIGLSALENGVVRLLNYCNFDINSVIKIISTYLRTGNFNVIPDNGVRESFSNVGVRLMKQAIVLCNCFRVSEYVLKVYDDKFSVVDDVKRKK